MKAETQREVSEEQKRVKAEKKQWEEEKEKRRIEHFAEQRRVKQEALAWKAMQDAEFKKVGFRFSTFLILFPEILSRHALGGWIVLVRFRLAAQ